MCNLTKQKKNRQTTNIDYKETYITIAKIKHTNKTHTHTEN